MINKNNVNLWAKQMWPKSGCQTVTNAWRELQAVFDKYELYVYYLIRADQIWLAAVRDVKNRRKFLNEAATSVTWPAHMCTK